MKLLNEIVFLLMNEDCSLNSALLKTKVLLHELGHRELVSWVNGELVGYSRDADLPDYRTIKSRIYGNITNGYRTYQSYAVPMMHLSEKQREDLETADMRHGLDVIEKMIAGASLKGSMTRQIPLEMNSQLSKSFNNGYFIEAAWSQIEVAQMRQIVTVVRSRLLDFILDLRSELGVNSSDENIKERTADMNIPKMFEKAVFGNNVTILMGDNNSQHVTNSIVKGDTRSLASELRKHGVDEEDIETLQAAVNEDPTPTVSEEYGPAVRGWISRMMGKAGDTSWKISISAAGGVLAGVLKSYYGL